MYNSSLFVVVLSLFTVLSKAQVVPTDGPEVLYGPETLRSQDMQYTRSERNIDLSELPAGRYKLKVQNGNAGPFLAKQCEVFTIFEQKRQCQFENLVEKTDKSFNRVEKAAGYLNGKKLTLAKAIDKSKSYFEESITLGNGNNILAFDVLGYPEAGLTISVEEFESLNNKPTALFSVSALTAYAPATITFNAGHSFDPDNQSLTYSWDFGDGTTGSGVKVSKKFNSVGQFEVKLRVRDPQGNYDDFSALIVTKAKVVKPVNKRPELTFNLSYPDPADLRRVLVSTDGSFDPDGTIERTEITWGDGQKSIGAPFEHIYMSEGTFLITVKVTDDDGAVTSKQKSISVSFANSLQAAESVLGPRTYSGSFKKEDRVIENLNIDPLKINDLYELTIQNADGEPHPIITCTGNIFQKISCMYTNLIHKTYRSFYRVDYAHVYVNGKRVTGSNSINKTNINYKTLVKLKAHNKIDIRYRGYPTAYIVVELKRMSVVRDTTPPLLSVNLENGFLTSDSNLSVIVTDGSPTTTQVLINGSEVENTSQKQFGVVMPEGNLQIEVRSQDSSGNATQPLILSGKTDYTAPMVTYSGPTDLYFRSFPAQHELTFQSEAEVDASTNGNPAGDMGGGVYKGNVTIERAGIVVVSLAAVDDAGNTRGLNVVLNVSLDVTAPLISSNLPERSVVGVPTVQFHIDVIELNSAYTTIFVNGQDRLQTGAKSFDYSVLLDREGDNLIEIKSTDIAGNTSIPYVRIVTKDTTSPVLTSYSPLNGSLIRAASFTVTGVTNEPISSVSINGLVATVGPDEKSFSANYVTQTMGSQSLHWILTDKVGNVSTYDSTVNLDSTLLVPSLVSAQPDVDGIHILIVGATGAARAGAEVKATTGVLSLNRATGTVNSDGSFVLKLTNFLGATLTATDQSVSQSMQVNFSGATILSGVVKDSNDVPLVGAKVSIQGTTLNVNSDANGAFVLNSPNPGDQKLIIDGTTIPQAVTGPNRKFSKTFISVNIGVGQQNTLPRPVYLTPVLLNGTQTAVTTNSAAIATSPDSSDIALTIPAGKANFPNGSNAGEISIAVVDANRTTLNVPQNAIPSKVIALEPSGLQFQERVKLTIPNDADLPPGVEMLIVSMNSSKGKWEVDGLATVDENGQTITTKDGLGISHFSTVYAIPAQPVLKEVGNPNVLGIDASQGSFETKIELPSFKSLGKDVKLGLRYKSAWAHPTAVISNLIDIPETRTTFSFQSQSQGAEIQRVLKRFCLPAYLGRVCHDDYENFYIDYISKFDGTYTSWYQPSSIKSQFFVGTVASDEVRFQDQEVILDANSPSLPGYNFGSKLESPVVAYTGLPNKSYMTYGVELKDPVTNKFLASGSYPSLARYQITLRNITLTSSTSTQEVYVDGALHNRVITPSNSIESTVLDSIMPQDLLSSIIVQNKTESPAGVGWHIGGAQRILNPASSKLVLEEEDGSVSTYAVSQSINTIYDGNVGGALDFSSNIDLSLWPYALGVKYDSSATSGIHEVDLLSQGSRFIGDIATPNGYVGNQGYYACSSNPSGSFTATRHSFKVLAKTAGFSRGADGAIYFTDSRSHSIGKSLSGTYSKLAGALASIEATYTGPAGVNLNDSAMNSFCRANFGNDCGAGTGVASYACSQVNMSTGCLNNQVCTGPISPSSGDIGFAGYRGDGSLGWLGHRVFKDLVSFNNPSALLAYPNGQVLVADTGNNRIRLLDFSTNTVTSYAGDGSSLDQGDGGSVTQSKMFHPLGLAKDTLGNLYISTEAGYIRKVDLNGTITTLAGKPLGQGGVLSDEAPMKLMAFNRPTNMILDEVNRFLYVSDTGNNRVVRIDLNTEIASNVAGDGTCLTGNIGDGKSALLASICAPGALGLDDKRNLLVVDTGHKKIRRINFTQVSSGALSFAPSNSDGSSLLKKSDGSFERIFRNGGKAIFDSSGKQTILSNRLGQQVTYSYNSSGTLSRITDAVGQQTSFEYSGDKLTAIQDPANRRTVFAYDGNRLSRVIFPDGTQRRFEYDAKDLLVKEFDQLNYSTEYVYNGWNKLTKTKNALGSETIMNDYWSSQILSSYISNVGSLNNPGLDSGQAHSSIQTASGSITKFEFDLSGSISEISDPLGRITKVRRSANGLPIKVEKPNGLVLTMSYASSGNDLISQTDEKSGITQTFSYDENGNVTKVMDNFGRSILRNYNPINGLLVFEKKINGQTVNYTYDSRGLVTQILNSSSSEVPILTTLEYDTKGNILSKKIDGRLETRFEYDLSGNITKQTKYDSSGVSQSTTLSYDEANRLVSIRNPKGDVTSYSYFATGQLSEVVSALGKVTKYEVNAVGQVTKKIDSNGKATVYQYDLNGRQVGIVDSNGNVTSKTYDAMDQLVKVQTSDDVITYEYDSEGEVISAANKFSKVVFDRDLRGRVIYTKSEGLGELISYPSVAISYAYNTADQITSVSSSLGTNEFSYDDAHGRLVGINTTNFGNFTFGYNSRGVLSYLSRPGSSTEVSYESTGMINEISHKANGLSVGFSSYAYNPDSTVGSKSDIFGTIQYRYDQNQQLVSATIPNANAEIFVYDSLGNRVSDSEGNYIYEPNNSQLLEDTKYFYTYDSNGNLVMKTARVAGEQSIQFSYNASGKLIEMKYFNLMLGSPIKTVKYYYDSIGRRMQKMVAVYSGGITSTKSRSFVYDGENIYAEFDQNNSLLATYLQSPGGMDGNLAISVTNIGRTAGIAPSAGSFYYMKDILGTITQIADSGGNILQRFEYSSFGSILSIRNGNGSVVSSPVIDQPFAFAGREYDQESGLYYNRARYYDPRIGRFLQKDPDPGVLNASMTLNPYIYATNIPTMITDPSGRWIFVVGIIASALIGGYISDRQGNGFLTGAVLGAATFAGGWYAGAALAGYMGMTGASAALVGGAAGALAGGVIGAAGYRGLGMGTPAEGFMFGVGFGASGGALGGWLDNGLVAKGYEGYAKGINKSVEEFNKKYLSKEMIQSGYSFNISGIVPYIAAAEPLVVGVGAPIYAGSIAYGCFNNNCNIPYVSGSINF